MGKNVIDWDLIKSRFRHPMKVAASVREEGWEGEPEDLARISPYLTEHINRFDAYSTHELGTSPRRMTRSWTSTSPRSASRT
ncbi:Tn3 family transposase [Streptomyces sp. NBRC 110465]|uniref:Tn3 family transposase n=1 Tax=Streptomyces sp. NBRC 110465 TaxID=1897621 RepID=UPI00093407B0|nr:Tn3 family transposase [Streptomyces sp. NBRC 110465]